jgi:hypothetical protein
MRPFLLLLALLLGASGLAAKSHPHLLYTAEDFAAMRAAQGKFPLFDAAVADARRRVDRALAAPLDVPQPKDAAGYTHERHKQNYTEMQLAGFLYQLTGEPRYADFVREHLRRYAALYPTLGRHPAANKQSHGRIFWQSLNETVWLVHVSLAYDCVYDTIPAEEHAALKKNLFGPMMNFLCEERIEEFDRIHNHGTWASTAVGLAGYVTGDMEHVDKALRGSKRDGSAGFLRQMDLLFSPDGYYLEGPYYARYALWPFFLFAEVVERNQPELKIYAHRGELLRKAFYALIQQSYVNGEFLPFNDSLKEKSYLSPEVAIQLNLAFARYGGDPALLSVARRQNAVSLTPAGLATAAALAATPAPPPFPYASVEFRDGPDGTHGGIGLLRAEDDPGRPLALMKYTAFGMEHGHYDKLALLYSDNGREVLPDYGAARFLNIEQKFGGRYLPENKTYALQTIAHNTVTVDGRSNYDGDYDTADRSHSDRHFFTAADPAFQVMSARDAVAYPGVAMQRTVAMIRDPKLAHPVLVDVFRLVSEKSRQYDYPLHYSGHFLSGNTEYTAHTASRRPLGDQHGYQHLWVEAEADAKGPLSFTWLQGDRFYTAVSATAPGAKIFYTRVGANDPKFNLRPETAVIQRVNATNHVFATVIEPHGRWDATREVTAGGAPTFRSVEVVAATAEGTVVRLQGANGLDWTLMVSNRDQPAGAHVVETSAGKVIWDGPAALRKY